MTVMTQTRTQTRTWTRTPRLLSVALWAAQILLAFGFVSGGWLKLSGDPVMVDLFDTIGIGQWFRIVVGALEVAGGLGLLVPRLTGLAARGLVALLVGAAVTNVLLGLFPWVPFAYLVVAAFIAWGRPAPLPGRLGRGRRATG
jgi:putative oxidoreductase